MALARWAVVKRVPPPPGDSLASMTMTSRPACARWYAVLRPAMPAPRTQALQVMSRARGGPWNSARLSFQGGELACRDMSEPFGGCGYAALASNRASGKLAKTLA